MAKRKAAKKKKKKATKKRKVGFSTISYGINQRQVKGQEEGQEEGQEGHQEEEESHQEKGPLLVSPAGEHLPGDRGEL